ncbi:VIT1/CCC1 family predicted Fe2+/Mn2+ transporter [Flammeovirga kamogawensis]|nr:VIT1/CCC1 family predicted Fe2+/Mn2+ transporter [Flammeovirga kamogawensis]
MIGVMSTVLFMFVFLIGIFSSILKSKHTIEGLALVASIIMISFIINKLFGLM